MVSYISASTSHTLASVYQLNSDALSKTLGQLVSGKKFLTPSDDAVSYFRSKAFDANANTYSDVKSQLDEWNGALDVAATAAGEIKTNLDRMQELIYMASASSATASDKTNYQNEFYNLALSNQNLVSNTYYQKKALLGSGAALTTITVNPDDTTPGTITINPGKALADAQVTNMAAPGTDNLTGVGGTIAAAQTDVTAAQTSIASYIGSVAGSQKILQSQSNVTGSIIENAQSASTLISGIDEAETIATYTAQDIQKQAAIAMMAQANQSNHNILMLFGIRGG
ncbi:MAG: flagellin [Chitinivibrionales bacterium]|nr:flagellin [Chitinivibrionales bacterium]